MIPYIAPPPLLSPGDVIAHKDHLCGLRRAIVVESSPDLDYVKVVQIDGTSMSRYLVPHKHIVGIYVVGWLDKLRKLDKESDE